MDHFKKWRFLVLICLCSAQCRAQIPLTTYSRNGEKFHKLVFYNNKLYVGGNKYVYMFNTHLYSEQTVAICNERCEANVNKLLLINSRANELIECSSGDGGICKIRDLDTLTLKWNSSTISIVDERRLEIGLTMSTDKEWPAQAHLTETGGYLVIALTNGSGVSNERKTYSPISLWTVNQAQLTYKMEFKKQLNSYRIVYISTFRFGHYSYFFTNQMQFPNQTKMVSKMVRLNQRFVNPFQSYTDFVIECRDNTGKAYTIVQDAILVHINGTPTVAAIFTTDTRDYGSILCTKPLADINKQAIESWINFINNSYCSETKFQSYFEHLDYCDRQWNWKADVSEELRSEDPNTKYPFDPLLFYSVDWTILPMKYVANSFTQEGSMITIHDSLLNNQLVLTVGTTSGIVVQFVYTDGTYKRYNTFQISESSSIVSLYQHLDRDHSLFVMTRNQLYKYTSTRCNEYAGSHCVKSGVMEGKNPLCGWCIYDQRASLKSDCSCSTTVCWLSSLTSCMKLDIEPKGTPAVTELVDIQLTTSLSLPVGSMYPYFCRWKNGAIKPAARNWDKFTCSMEHMEYPSNTKMTLEFGVKLMNKDVLLTETPFLFYRCSNFQRCNECTNAVGAQCTWCPLEGQCLPPNATCQHAVTFQTQTCPQLANHNDQFYVPSGVHSSLTINVTNNFPTVNVSFRLIGANFGIDSSCKTAFSQITCGLKALIHGKRNSVPILIQYLSSKNGWVSIEDKNNLTLTFYNCSNLGEFGCNYCKALNSNRYTCAWDTTANMCMFNENSSDIGTTDCPAPTIMKILPEDGPYNGAVSVTLTGSEFGLVEKEPISGPVTVSGKSCLSIVDIIYVPDDRLDFMHNVRTGLRCRSTSRPVNNNTIFTISRKPSTLGRDFKPLILKNSTITRVYPDYGPRAGGTRITLYGENLGIGNRNLETVHVHGKQLIGSNISSIKGGTGQDVYAIIGEIPTGDFIGKTSIVVLLNDVEIISESATFLFLENPTIKDMNPKHGFLSGGTILTVTGDTLANAQLPRVFLRGHESSESCLPKVNSTKILYCKVPVAPTDVISHLHSETFPEGLEVDIVVKLDGIEKTFTLNYYHDPSLSKFDNGLQLFDAKERYLAITGENLRLLSFSDVNITIGIEQCRIVELSDNLIVCNAPTEQPQPGMPGLENPEVNVTIGNIKTTLGYLKYKTEVQNIPLIAGASAGGAAVLILIVASVAFIKSRKRIAKAKAMNEELNYGELHENIRPPEEHPYSHIVHG